MEKDIILDIKGISKSFPGVNALDDVSFQIHKGQVHAIVGENGAGKSTLIKIIAGIYKSDQGALIYDGAELKNTSPINCIRLGISTVHQELRLAENLTVVENLFLGRPFKKGFFVDWKRMRIEAQKKIAEMGVDIDINTMVSELSVSKKQIVEICKAITLNAKVIVMDEPSSTLTDTELEVLFDIIQKLKNEGITVIYISHRLEEIFAIADKVTVLRDGKHISTSDISDIDKNGLIAQMVGRKIENIFPPKTAETKEVVLSVKGLNREKVLHDVSFDLHKGEILGIAGLVGSGRTEVARAIFGADKLDSGEIYINGNKGKIKSINDAVKSKIALIPEERKTQGIIPLLPVSQNITIIGLKEVLELKAFISKRKETEVSRNYIDMLKIATPSTEARIQDLSGGNQQKCILAKWILVDADIIIFDEPTRGIDVGAKHEIYKLLDSLAAQGKGIIMISSELAEIIGMADRVLVMHDGRITGEVKGEDATQETIMRYATL
jgi:ABC-type sugar transport system, ATPase component